jgi:YidC/Oxa1 family membrane protein insertase
MSQQRRLAPELAELKKKYKSDPQKQQAAMMQLYKEHGVNPLGGLSGCLPAVLQFPILTALYYVFTGFAHRATVAAHFLFIPNLNDNPNHHLLVNLVGGIGIPSPEYLVFPLLAAATTFVQTKMLQMPPAPNLTEQEAQAQQMQKMMVWMSPLMIGYFALNVPAGLGLYWFVSNCFAIIQQYFVNGWGGMRRGGPPPLQATPPSVKPKPKDPGPAPKAPPGARPRRARR